MKSFVLHCFNILALVATSNAQTTPCAGGELMGANPTTNNNNVGTSIGSYYLACGGIFDSSCCGSVSTFNYWSRADGTLTLAIWRPVGGGLYNMVSSTTDTITGTSGGGDLRAKTLVAPIQIQPGDCVAWATSGTDIVAHKSVAGQNVVFLSTATVGTLTTVDWSAAATAGTKSFAINAELAAPIIPTFTTAVTAYSIPDTTATGVPITTVTFVDGDAGDVMTITWTSAQSLYFDVTDNGDGTASVKTSTSQSMSGLSGQTATLSFTATDVCGSVGTGAITVTVVNEPPAITNLVPAASISEDITIETSITSYTCSDPTDQVESGVLSITPSNAPSPEFFFSRFETGTGTSNVYGIFARAQSDPNNGVFDYNVQRDYMLTIRCSDTKADVTDTIIMNLLQNTPPTITNLPSPTSITVSKTVRKGDIVFTVLFTDAEDDTVSFTSTCDPPGCPFDVTDSGQLQATENLDTVSVISYDMTITVSDAKNSGIPRKLTIVVTDGFAFTQLPYTLDVFENTVNPTALHTITYTGIDPAAAILTMDFSSLFALNSSTGVVSTISAINYEALTQTTYPLAVSLSDGTANITSTLTINVIDVNENLTWNSPTYRTNVNEGMAVGTTVPDPGFAITDQDVNDTYTCTMDCGDLNGYFSLSTSCVITVSAIYSLDAGLNNTVPCVVSAKDKGDHTATTTLIIDIVDVDDYTPAFNTFSYTFSVSAYAGVNTAIGVVTATDRDTGTFGEFTYSLNQSSLPGNYFKIDGSTGEISTQVNLPTECACSQTTFTILAHATDTGGLVGTSTVYISVGEYTTTSTTTTTDRYRKFFEDTRNVAWFSVAMAALLVSAVVSAFVVGYYLLNGPNICMAFRKRKRRYSIRRFPPSETRTRFTEPASPDTVRKPPPPKDHQPWRSESLVYYPTLVRKTVAIPVHQRVLY